MQGALSVRLVAAGVTVIPAGALDESVTLPLKPLIGVKASVPIPDPEGEIESSAFCVVSEKSDWATVTLTELEEADV